MNYAERANSSCAKSWGEHNANFPTRGTAQNTFQRIITQLIIKSAKKSDLESKEETEHEAKYEPGPI